MSVTFTLDGRAVSCDDDQISLLQAIRGLGNISPKDGCSPQGQCGCCTVLVDGAPRVSCVTAVRRVSGRRVTTAEGLDPDLLSRLTGAFVEAGASQCGFCTPGILCRVAVLGERPDPRKVENALLAHLCRCTGWRGIMEAVLDGDRTEAASGPTDVADGPRRRASLEGATTQNADRQTIIGHGGFAADTAPRDALVAMLDTGGEWVVGESAAEAAALAGKIQGRRSGHQPLPPLEIPDGQWDLTLATSWVEPGYLEPDASWCLPGGEPASSLGNGGAFGSKTSSELPGVARRMADSTGRAVLALYTREDVVRRGPKRPPLAAGLNRDGSGVIAVAATPGITQAIHSVLPRVEVREIVIPGPPTSTAIRAAGWGEASILGAALRSLDDPPSAGEPVEVDLTSPGGGRSLVRVSYSQGRISLIEAEVWAGQLLSEPVLRSYVTGAAHMGLGWVLSEGLSLDPGGVPEDLTVRSWGILRARDMPEVRVITSGDQDQAAVAVSDSVFCAVAAAAWIGAGLRPSWPVARASFV